MNISLVKIHLIIFCTNMRMMLCDNLVHDANRTLANELAKKVRILCAVIQNGSDPERQKAIEDTWGKRCNGLIFLNADKGCTTKKAYCGPKTHEWQITFDQQCCVSILEQYHSEFEWYLLINSKGYIIPENMRYMLADHNPNNNIYFMSNVRQLQGLNLILSRKALDTYAHADIYTLCNRNHDSFQSRAKCFSAIGLTAADSRDSWGKDRILPDNPYVRAYPAGHQKFWYCDRFVGSKDPSRRVVVDYEGYDCFSDFAVSFDYASTHLIYVIDFLVYQLRPYGINYRFDIPKILGGRKSVIKEKHLAKQKIHHAKLNDTQLKHRKKHFKHKYYYHSKQKVKSLKHKVSHLKLSDNHLNQNGDHSKQKDKDIKDNSKQKDKDIKQSTKLPEIEYDRDVKDYFKEDDDYFHLTLHLNK